MRRKRAFEEHVPALLQQTCPQFGFQLAHDGWISFYWDTPPEKLRQSKEIKDALMLDWLERFQKRAERTK